MYLDDILFTKHLEDDEHMSRIVHKHWSMGARYIFWPLLLFIALWGSLYIIPYKSWFYLVSLVSVGLLVWAARNFFDYYMDAWLITDHGIIDLEWKGWFHRQSSRVLYSDIQGVSYEIVGVAGTLLRFGTISVEKISTGAVISLTNVEQPKTIESLILKNMEAYLHTKNLKDSRHVQELLANYVAQEVQLHNVKAKKKFAPSSDA